MIDCGGQGSFINNDFSQQYQLPCRPKSFPVSLILADGSQPQAGPLTQYNPVLLRTAGNEELLGLDIAPTSHDIILGMPWLKKHDQAIRFGRQELTFDSPFVSDTVAITARPYPSTHLITNLEREKLMREMELGRFCLQGT